MDDPAMIAANGPGPEPDLVLAPPLTGPYPGRIMPVPAHLRADLAPATWCIYEWTEYHARFPGADRLRVGSQWLSPAIGDVFAITFANQLGLTSITPYHGASQVGERIHLEVLATKFAGPDASVTFLRNILDDLFTQSSSLPFVLSAATERRVREAYRPPNLLFAFHFFRHHRSALIRALQVILGHPHRVLADDPAMVRLHQVKRIESEAMRLMIRTARGMASGSAPESTLQRLRPERVLQRIPVESFDTPENRFVLAICRMMLTTIERIARAPWFGRPAVAEVDRRAIRDVREYLRILTTDSRFAPLESTVRMPTQSRVLQRRDGYRELSLLWQVFQRARQPVFDDLDAAIDLGDIATLYEYWVLFALIDQIRALTGVEPRLTARLSEFGHPERGFSARFGEIGTLHYNRSFEGYSGIGLRPDYVWELPEGDLVVMDAKFRMTRPWSPGAVAAEPSPTADAAATYKDDDIQKMHTYRDALDRVRAAIVLYPGTEAMFRTTAGHRREIRLQDVLAGDLDGIGALPMIPLPNESSE